MPWPDEFGESVSSRGTWLATPTCVVSSQLSEISLPVDPRLGKDPRLPQTGELVAARYRVRKPIACGGMSVVFVADDELLGREVALKVLYPIMRHNDAAVARFMNEACTLAQLHSHYVVTVHDSGFAACDGSVDLPFMTLELLHGADLWTLIHEHGRPEPARAVSYLLDACEGLAAAHARGVVHRDLKPENLFVVRARDGSDYIKVFDFGLAKAPRLKGRRQITRHGETMGSPHYMSPEQLQVPQDVDAQSDVWALGAVLYELLTGQLPFQAPTPLEICARIVSKEPLPVSALRPDLPIGLSQAVERCLTRERRARFADVSELGEALAPFADSRDRACVARVQRLHHLLGRDQEALLLRRRRASSPPPETPAPRASLRSTGRSMRRWLALAIPV